MLISNLQYNTQVYISDIQLNVIKKLSLYASVHCTGYSYVQSYLEAAAEALTAKEPTKLDPIIPTAAFCGSVM